MNYTLYFGTRKLIATVEILRTYSGFVATFTNNLTGVAIEKHYKTERACKAAKTRYFNTMHNVYFQRYENGAI